MNDGLAPLSLLLVEDDPALSQYLSETLSAHGYLVQCAGDRPEALEKMAASPPPNLILLDLGLPPQPSTPTVGLGLLDDCVNLLPCAKIIVLTGQDERVAAQEAIRRGAFDFLLKPAAQSQIIAALQRAALFYRQEAALAQQGITRLSLSARVGDGPREAASAAEEQLLRRTLTEAGHNVAETARRLGISREHLYYYLKKYGIKRPG